ncbi:hypothetical protein SDRG_13018 [Saprolegnia diclina VS20]|uniref:Uncharacterized protein n=1 Tax=Saprolegnia diclina (strain VS20) TaxID=1156394 RepID=T0Q3I9_SAPDV|nr:hypothetical protein SDRG_13018 [Saprolegnia diclina VS20]EQC29146.1 hypothetical protein SDRG_13018 [Saprolegnia diclina VS20]|eukprot:XP_008617324.1 hypothetical protein SDRG_13018 [Saprolegnia diclina VS20]
MSSATKDEGDLTETLRQATESSVHLQDALMTTEEDVINLAVEQFNKTALGLQHWVVDQSKLLDSTMLLQRLPVLDKMLAQMSCEVSAVDAAPSDDQVAMDGTMDAATCKMTTWSMTDTAMDATVDAMMNTGMHKMTTRSMTPKKGQPPALNTPSKGKSAKKAKGKSPKKPVAPPLDPATVLADLRAAGVVSPAGVREHYAGDALFKVCSGLGLHSIRLRSKCAKVIFTYLKTFAKVEESASRSPMYMH